MRGCFLWRYRKHLLYLPSNIYPITMNTIACIRLQSHQLGTPLFDSPKQLVQWMGAIQAQEYNMAKWALGIRLPSATLADVERALREGEILRTHILRPTWHFVASEDIRWMLQLTGARIKAANEQYAKSIKLEIEPKEFNRFNDLAVKALEGGQSLTRDELGEALARAGMPLFQKPLAGKPGRFRLVVGADHVRCTQGNRLYRTGTGKGKNRNARTIHTRNLSHCHRAGRHPAPASLL